MKISLHAVAVVLAVGLAGSGCNRAPGGPPSERDCRAGCERLATWRMAKDRKGRESIVHEADESVDDQEARSKKDIDEIHKEIAEQVGYKFDTKELDQLSPSVRKATLEAHEWQVTQLKQQREHAIHTSEQAVEEAKQGYVSAQKQFADWLAQTTADEVGKCMPTCMAHRESYAQCLLKTQAPQDQEICDKL